MIEQLKNPADLFKRAYNLEREVLDAKELQKELKAEFAYDKDVNVGGLEKKYVAKVIKAAKSHAKQDNLKEKADELLEINEIINELED